MRIPWDERQARIAEMRQRELQPKEKPRLALRVARYFIGNDYDEEVLPAIMINFFAFLAIILAPFWAIEWLVKWICRGLKEAGVYVLIFCVLCLVALFEKPSTSDPDEDSWQ